MTFAAMLAAIDGIVGHPRCALFHLENAYMAVLAEQLLLNRMSGMLVNHVTRSAAFIGEIDKTACIYHRYESQDSESGY